MRPKSPPNNTVPTARPCMSSTDAHDLSTSRAMHHASSCRVKSSWAARRPSRRVPSRSACTSSPRRTGVGSITSDGSSAPNRSSLLDIGRVVVYEFLEGRKRASDVLSGGRYPFVWWDMPSTRRGLTEEYHWGRREFSEYALGNLLRTEAGKPTSFRASED